MVLRGTTQKLLRWPILICVFTILTLEFLAYLAVRFSVQIYELSSRWRYRKEKAALKNATDFVTWCQAARELDRIEGRDQWKAQDESPYYDYPLIREHISSLTQLRNDRNYDGLMSALKLIYQTYNIGGINNHQLYKETHFGTKYLVSDFIQTVLECSIFVRDAEELTIQQRRDFFRRARKWYGRTALLLSGGATMGYYHAGVLKTLIEAKCLPQIISGASAGSLICSFIAVRTDQEVLDELCVPDGQKYFRACSEPVLTKLTRWLKTGYCFDKANWIALMRNGITKGDTTFLEAYQKYGRIINIAVTASSKYAPTLILNYRSTPDVVIWSAVLASSAFPNFLEPIELQLKNPKTGVLEGFHVHGLTFTDGTIKNDIPIKEMTKMWDANFFVVSQCNPHLVPFFFGQHGGSGRPAPSLRKNVSSGLRGGFILSMFEKLLKLDIKKWFKLIADLDLLPIIFGTDWRFIYLQKLTGTVTIVPAAPISSYFRIISDPTKEHWQHYITEGERASWYKLCRISNHYRLEKMLIECSRYLDKQAKKMGLPVKKEKFSHINAGIVASMVSGGMDGTDPANGSGSDGASASASPMNDENESPDGATSSSSFANPAAASSSSSSNNFNSTTTLTHTVRERKSSRNLTLNFTSTLPTTSNSSTEGEQAERALFHLQGSPIASPMTGSTSLTHSVSVSPTAKSASSHALESSDDDATADERDTAVHAPGEIQQTATAALLTQDVSSWRRGVDTDTDNTDEEEEEGSPPN